MSLEVTNNSTREWHSHSVRAADVVIKSFSKIEGMPNKAVAALALLAISPLVIPIFLLMDAICGAAHIINGFWEEREVRSGSPREQILEDAQKLKAKASETEDISSRVAEQLDTAREELASRVITYISDAGLNLDGMKNFVDEVRDALGDAKSPNKMEYLVFTDSEKWGFDDFLEQEFADKMSEEFLDEFVRNPIEAVNKFMDNATVFQTVLPDANTDVFSPEDLDAIREAVIEILWQGTIEVDELNTLLVDMKDAGFPNIELVAIDKIVQQMKTLEQEQGKARSRFAVFEKQLQDVMKYEQKAGEVEAKRAAIAPLQAELQEEVTVKFEKKIPVNGSKKAVKECQEEYQKLLLDSQAQIREEQKKRDAFDREAVVLGTLELEANDLLGNLGGQTRQSINDAKALLQEEIQARDQKIQELKAGLDEHFKAVDEEDLDDDVFEVGEDTFVGSDDALGTESADNFPGTPPSSLVEGSPVFYDFEEPEKTPLRQGWFW